RARRRAVGFIVMESRESGDSAKAGKTQTAPSRLHPPHKNEHLIHDWALSFASMTAASALHAQWIAHLRDERRFAANSVEAYERDVETFLDFLQGHLGGDPSAKDLAELAPRDLRAYLAHRRQGPGALSDRSVSRALAAIRSFYRYLERRHGLTNPRLSLVRGPKLARTLPRPVSEKAARDLIADAAASATQDWIG